MYGDLGFDIARTKTLDELYSEHIKTFSDEDLIHDFHMRETDLYRLAIIHELKARHNISSRADLEKLLTDGRPPIRNVYMNSNFTDTELCNLYFRNKKDTELAIIGGERKKDLIRKEFERRWPETIGSTTEDFETYIALKG